MLNERVEEFKEIYEEFYREELVRKQNQISLLLKEMNSIDSSKYFEAFINGDPITRNDQNTEAINQTVEFLGKVLESEEEYREEIRPLYNNIYYKTNHLKWNLIIHVICCLRNIFRSI